MAENKRNHDQAMALREARPDASSLQTQYLSISVSGMEMGISLAHVSEIVPYEGVSSVPGTPAYVRGIVHVRERVIPVVDLAVKLGRKPAPIGKRTCILMLDLVVDGEKLPVGVVMDGVATLLDVDKSQIRPAPKFGGSIQVQYLHGILPTERAMLPLIDVDRVFAADELSQVAAVVDEDSDDYA